MSIGLGLPNSTMSADDWRRIEALRVTDVVDLHHFAGRWADVKRRWPSCHIHARIDKRGTLGNPLLEAAELAALWYLYGHLVSSWRMRNEVNLPSEGEGATPSQWRNFAIDFGREVKRLCPGIILYLPAVAPWTPDWDAWLDASASVMREPQLYDGWDTHVYGEPNEVDNILWKMRTLYGGPIIATELNFGAGRQVDVAAYAERLPAVLAMCEKWNVSRVCWFIYRWCSPDQQLPTSLDVTAHPALERKMMELNKPAPVPTQKLYLAVIPSNQDRNVGVSGVSEDTQCAKLAAQILEVSRVYPVAQIKVFTGSPESKDTTYLAGLISQQNQAKAWLDTAPAGALTVALNFHTDSGRNWSHLGYYWKADPPGYVSKQVGKACIDALLPIWGNTQVVNADYSGYVFARYVGKHCPALLELGSHEDAGDCAKLVNQGPQIAETILLAILRLFGLSAATPTSPLPPVTPAINWAIVGDYATWALARVGAREEPRDKVAFEKHLVAIGNPPPVDTPAHGWPA